MAEKPERKESSPPPNDSQRRVDKVSEEALTILAREIVREAGLAQDPERAAQLEASKLRVEAAKTQVLLSSGALVAMAAVVGVLQTSRYLFFMEWAVIFIAVSVLGGFLCMDDVARAVTNLRPPPQAVSWFGPTLLAFGLCMFALYVFYNIPLGQAEGLLAWTRARLAVQMLFGAVILLALGFTIFVFVRRRASSR